MNELTQKIARQSKIILILAKIARIILYVVLGVTIFLLISTWVPGDQPIFRLGGTEVFATMPLKTLLGVGLAEGLAQQLPSLRLDLIGQLFAFILAQVMLHLVTKLFTRIRESENPFTADVVKSMKALAILLGLVIGVENTIVGVVIAFVIFAFAMIFQYGAELQHQVDETL